MGLVSNRQSRLTALFRESLIMLSIQQVMNTVVMTAIVQASFAFAAEPPSKTRAPDDRMLQELERKTREVRAPIVPEDPQPESAPKSFFSELLLTGPRGKETPSVAKNGRYCENGFARAGFSNCIGRFAQPSTDAYHQVGYVGGGTLFGGSCRHSNEGTFGMDYSGYWFSRKTWLKWSHGQRHQGGAGRYETEGPRILPE